MAKTRERREARRTASQPEKQTYTHTLDEIEKAFPDPNMQKGLFRMCDSSGKKIDIAEMRKIKPSYTYESKYTLEQIHGFLF